MSENMLDEELLNEFLAESTELLQVADENLLALEKDLQSRELVENIFRPIHSIKGNSSFFGLFNLKTIAHKMEDVLDAIRKDAIGVNHTLISILLKTSDYLKQLLDKIASARSEIAVGPEHQQILDKLNQSLSAHGPYSPEHLSEIASQLQAYLREHPTVPAGICNHLEAIEALMGSSAPSAESEKLPQAASTEAQVALQTPLPAAPEATGTPPAKVEKTKGAVEKTMRIPEEALDSFFSYVGELIIVVEMFHHLQQKITPVLSSDVNREMLQATSLFESLSQDLQTKVMDLRKTPLKTILQQFPRTVRDIAEKKKKKIELVIEGDQTLVDKSITEHLQAPLMHIIRNCADHGIEAPEQRIKAGKNPQGRIRITALEQDDSLVLTVSDDGKGIDADSIMQKAIENGIISPSAQLREDEKLQLLFASGVSTAETISDISGRGVGMDVAKRNIEEAGGSIEIQTRKAAGSSFTITVPLSVSTRIIKGFAVVCQQTTFIFPLEKIEESFRLDDEHISHVAGQGTLISRRSLQLPYSPLVDIISDTSSAEAICQNPSTVAVVVQTPRGKRAIGVERILGVQQVVVKKMAGLSLKSDIFSGGAIMGDGSVGLIIDIASFTTELDTLQRTESSRIFTTA